ncbi:MAG: hypothetical protein WBZ36_07240 [Candidatus Nitrosopolaris sp.]
MIEEILVLACFSLAGGILALTMWKHQDSNLGFRKPRRTKVLRPLSATKSEIEALQFEKGILSHSITNICEAVQNGKINTIERDRLLSKYKSQLDTFNEKIGELQMSIDLTELSEMRTELVCLMEERIANIETKLTEISKKCQIQIGSFAHAKKRKYTTLKTRDEIETGEKKGEVKRESDVVSVEDKNIQKLQQEIIQALASLEHAGDVPKPVPINQELTENFENTAKIERHDKSRDALSFLKEAELEV